MGGHQITRPCRDPVVRTREVDDLLYIDDEVIGLAVNRHWLELEEDLIENALLEAVGNILMAHARAFFVKTWAENAIPFLSNEFVLVCKLRHPQVCGDLLVQLL